MEELNLRSLRKKEKKEKIPIADESFDILKREKKARGMTYVELADYLLVSKSVVNKWFCEKAIHTPLESLEFILDKLGYEIIIRPKK